VTINFTGIPSNLRVPLFYAELDPTYANTAAQDQRGLLVGQMSARERTLPAPWSS
jgi:phage tail sheath gpL-like